MRNLKKVLTLVLTLAMLLSVMVVGAGAATFGDQESITNKEAVDMCVALNVIGGYEDGTFRPTGNVTRAEMCKMICVALNGGKEPTMGSGLIGTFNDVSKDDWSAPYIEYCVSQGIVGGVGGGRFNPTGNITGTQAAKMLLCILGYDAAIQGYVGNDFWETKINVDAAQKGLYDELTNIDASAALTRDQAAQMIWNALNAYEVEYITTLVPGPDGTLVSKVDVRDKVVGENSDKITLMEDKYEAKTTNAGVLETVNYNSVKGNYTNSISGGITVVTTQDYSDLIGLTVVGVKNNKDTAKADYGICVDEGSIIATAYATDITGLDTAKKTIKMDGTTYNLDNASIAKRIYNVAGSTDVTAKGDINTGSQVAYLVDNDGDGDVDAVVLKPFTVGKITYVGTDSFTFTSAGATETPDKDDVVLYDGAAKDDVAVKTAAAQTTGTKDVYEKVEYVTNTISGVNKDGEWLIDGTWYTNSSSTTVNINDKVEYVAFGDVIYIAKVVENAAGAENLAMIYRAANKTATGNGVANDSVEIKLIKADGTKVTGTLAKINETKVSTVTDTTTNPGYVGNAVSSTTAANLIGAIVYFEVNSDGDYEVKTLPANYNTTKVLGYDGTGAASESFATTGDKFGTYEIADDAVVFYLDGANGTDNANNDAKVYTGKQLKNVNANVTGNVATFASSLYAKVNGFTYTTVAAINDGTADDNWLNIATGANYGYLTADAYQTKEGSDVYTNYTMWTKDGSITVKEKKNQTLDNFPAGTIVSYDVKGDGVVENVIAENANISYVAGFDGDKKLQINGASSSKIGDETVVLYINTKDDKGVSGGSISLADEPTSGNYINNVRYIDGGDAFALIVVDVNNKYEYDGTITAPDGATADDVNQILTSADVTLPAAANVTSPVTVPAGKTLTLNGGTVSNITANGDVVVNADTTTSIALADTGTVTLSGTTATIPTITGTGNVVIDKELAGDINFGGITQTAGTAAAGGTPVTVAEGLKLSGDKLVTGFSSVYTIDQLAARTQSKTVTPYIFTLTGAEAGELSGVMTLKSGGTQDCVFGQTTLTQGSSDTDAIDASGNLDLSFTAGDNVASVTYTITKSDSAKLTWTFQFP